MRYFNLRLRCYYFRFRILNGHHIGILLPVFNLSTYTSLWHDALYNPTNFVDMCPFSPMLLAAAMLKSNMASAVILDLWYSSTRLDKAPTGSQKSAENFATIGWQVFSMWIFHFCRLCLKMPYSRPFCQDFGGWPLNVVIYCRDPQNANPWPEGSTRVGFGV